MIYLHNFEPAELGLPAKFKSFRPAQIEAAEQICNDTKPYTFLDLPTGSGKTLIALAAAKALGMRAVILTSTLGLQEQYMRDFAEIGLVDIRGKSNYQCCATTSSCRFGRLEGCPYVKSDGHTIDCTYGAARNDALWSNLAVTNYAYWIRANERGPGLEPPDGLNPIEMLILDESHRAPEELSRTLQVVLREALLKKLQLDFRRTDDIDWWVAWATATLPAIEEMHGDAFRAYKRKRTKGNKELLYDLEHAKETIEKLRDVDSSSWVCEQRNPPLGRVWTFDPIWPGESSRKLFCGIPKVVAMSATNRPIIARMLGVPRHLYSFRDWPRVFPQERTPILHIPTVRLNHKAKPEDYETWVRRIDEIIGNRLDRKGLLHTVSYERQRYLLEHSRHASIMVANTSQPDSESATEVFKRFIEMEPPRVLVSPSFSTGWDFPGDHCRYQIIAKLPFPDSRSKLTQERMKRNPQYTNLLCMQDLQQAAGRGTRSASDWCEVFIVDDSVGWFMMQNKSLSSRWFTVDRASVVPPPIHFS